MAWGRRIDSVFWTHLAEIGRNILRHYKGYPSDEILSGEQDVWSELAGLEGVGGVGCWVCLEAGVGGGCAGKAGCGGGGIREGGVVGRWVTAGGATEERTALRQELPLKDSEYSCSAIGMAWIKV